MDLQNKETSVINCFFCMKHSHSNGCVLAEETCSLLDGAKIRKEYAPGHEIFREGDTCKGVYCVESGLIGVRKSDSKGESVLVRLAFPGDTLGYRPILADEPHRGGAEVLKRSVVCFIKKSVVRELISNNPALGLEFLQRAARTLGEAEEKYFENVTLSIRARLCHILLIFKDRYGKTDSSGGISFELPISRQDMAAAIGARPESMSRMIKKMHDDGVAIFSGRAVHIPHIDRLIDEL